MRVVLVAMLLLAGLAAVPALPAHAGDDAKVAFKISDPRISESSGLAASRRHPGIVYTHNDSGDQPRIFAIGPDGRTKATFTIAGAQARDWEGMTLGSDNKGRPALFIGDIGDNQDSWPYVTVYRVPEPNRIRDQVLRAKTFRLKYADGPRDAESILINPRTNRLYVASKKFAGELYEGPSKLRGRGMNELREVGDAPMYATDGAYSPDGRTFAIRTYFGSARIYSKPGEQIANVSLPSQKQGESLTYSADGRSLLVGSEGVNQPVWKIPLPEEALPSPKPKKGKTAGAKESKEEEGGGFRTIVLLALAALAVAGFLAIRRRR